MRTKFLFLFLGLISVSNIKCKLAGNPMPTTYQTIDESKKNKAFIIEYKPEQPYIEIEGFKHYIKNAWLEHAHFDKNWKDEIIINSACIVMSMAIIENHKPNLKNYIHEIGNGYTNVWIFAHNKNITDTVELKYRSDLTSESKNKIFRLFPVVK
jgi:hypothetical protein